MFRVLPRRHAVAAATAGTLVAVGLSTPGIARADTIKAEAKAPATAAFTVEGCTFGVTAPTQDRSGHVSAFAFSEGCTSNWTFTARLQTSRWWGWATDSEEHWTSDASPQLGTSCASRDAHRVILHWSNDLASGTMNSPTTNLNCR